MFSTDFKKMCRIFAENKHFKKSQMVAKINWLTCCETSVATLTVLK